MPQETDVRERSTGTKSSDCPDDRWPFLCNDAVTDLVDRATIQACRSKAT
jgi:hypothetical protein